MSRHLAGASANDLKFGRKFGLNGRAAKGEKCVIDVDLVKPVNEGNGRKIRKQKRKSEIVGSGMQLLSYLMGVILWK